MKQTSAESIDISFKTRKSADELARLSLARYANLEDNLLTWFSEPLIRISLSKSMVLIVQELVSQFLSDHTTHIIEHVQLLIVSPLLKNLMKAARSKKTWPHKFSILRAASEYVIFDDLAEQQHPDIGNAKETMLWPA
ncbi:hypothetical protein [Lentilitoribacter sp. EG35]|uniref:hypothetical protein n=1 Tax=Lentilitoribacter sp. EG35 TaxID=3234192 RepID=UPI00345FEAB5